MLLEQSLEEIVLELGFATSSEVEDAKSRRTRAQQPIVDVLLQGGVINAAQRLECLAIQSGIPFVQLTPEVVDHADLLGQQLSVRYHALVLDYTDFAATVAMADPQDLIAVTEIGRSLDRDIDPMWALDSEITERLQARYGAVNSVQNIILDVSRDLEASGIEVAREEEEEDESVVELRESAEGGPVVQLVNALFAQAIGARSSDIHIEPGKKSVKVRFRIDGVLTDAMEVPREVHRAMVSRVKIISGLDIAERRAPQDGRCSLATPEGEFDFRVATYPSVHGEKVCIRVLDKRRSLQALESLDIDREQLSHLVMNAEASQGLILVCGPTGSGKTTTLYSLLNHLNDSSRHIITVEDPVEYQLDGIIQGNVNNAAGLSFASGLRAMLRQDPDVILVGESRDPETAKTAIEASLTGHLVLTSLHANDSLSAIVRLVEMGIEPFLVGAAVTCAVSQRLVRKSCPHCLQSYSPDPAVLKRLGLSNDLEYKIGTGCEQCTGTGYRGRMGVFEVLTLTPKLRMMITENSPVGRLAEEARKSNFRTIQDDAREKVIRGQTSVDEILRVVAFEVGE